MKYLLLIAHGSRRQASNDEVRSLAKQMSIQTNATYHQVDCAFLELAEPSIPDGIQQCIDAGAEHVVVLPYFLSAGRHVVEDIPREVAIAQQRNPQAKIEIIPYLGAMTTMSNLLLEHANKS